ncbi:hypothetical protein SUGI_0722740 [Cryptomeria japonica]|nr:hypothetical protein SUGI_0722740 [Cryptomeria japonica]
MNGVVVATKWSGRRRVVLLLLPNEGNGESGYGLLGSRSVTSETSSFMGWDRNLVYWHGEPQLALAHMVPAIAPGFVTSYRLGWMLPLLMML